MEQDDEEATKKEEGRYGGKSGKRTRRSLKREGKEVVVEILKRRQPRHPYLGCFRLCASRARSSNLGQFF
ncbi:serine/threonine-protein kinase CBK1-like [Cucumis melo var. makuwa]|uniref:Serine/threonine-protein kinase CBK1-like n=1 Tax=Cucumis melo var. makuwa TaxID=1194695 RepID=A0A5D3CHT4_CUCMM|nr:serine/threonine-protein kinase CBK1-like [Cucumis melo var. makuwa]TYK09829.1 serine/threonine-protein kinase CBK1-like [Cucumis melo var. makuwa]